MYGQRLFALMISLGVSFYLPVSATESGAQESLPNIVLIVSDDQGYADMGVTGLAPDVQTPSLDALASQGTRFTQAYVTSPICSTSRLGLMTGTYTQRTGGYFYGEEGAISPKLETMAEMLKKQGYRTGYVGKYHYGYHDSQSRDFPLNHGFDRFYGTAGVGRKHYLIHDDAQHQAFLDKIHRYQRKGQNLEMTSMWDDRKKVTPQGFATEIFGEKAREFVRENQDKPFFLQLAFTAVHNFTHQLPAEYLKAHGLDAIKDWDPAKEDYYQWYQKGRYPNNPQGRAYYLAHLDYMDKEVGKLMQQLDDLKLRDNTLVIFLSDNGGSTPIYANNGPLRGSKYLLYEGGIRVPFLVSWPARLPKGAVLDNVISSMDVLPTLAAITGANTPPYVDGQNILPLLSGEKPDLNHDILVWDTGIGTAVRYGRWKLKTASDDWNAKYEMVAVELGMQLFDLHKDPGERTDVKDQNPEVFQQLQGVYLHWKNDMEKGLN